MTERIAKLEVQRVRLHDYILMKLESRDYHAVADAAMDLRELDVEVKILVEQYDQAQKAKTAISSGKVAPFSATV